MTTEELVVAIRVTAENAEETIEAVKTRCQELGAEVEQAKQAGNGAFTPMRDSAQEAATAQAVLASATAAAFAGIKRAVQGGTEAYNAYISATKGLDSIAKGRGIDQKALNQNLESVTDEFLDAASAASAYKNLLTRGFTLDQATRTIERLKDSATFGRAANLSLSEAVVTATEGLRQENSILVDNAGVTKNVAKMWEEYAKAHDLKTNELTQAQKVEAEYQGILRETALQAGDLAKASDTLAGAQAKSAAEGQKMAEAYGSAMAPSMQLAAEVSADLFSGIRELVTAAPGITSGMTAAAAAVSLYMTVTKAAAAAQKIFTAASAAMNPVMAGLAAAAGVAVAAYTAYKKSQQEAAEAAETAKREQEQAVKSLSNQAAELSKIGQEYKSLTDNQSRSEAQNTRLQAVIETLASEYGVSREALQGLAGAYDSGNDAIEDRIRLYGEEIQAILEKQRAEKQAMLEAAEAEHQQRAKALGELAAAGTPDFHVKAGFVKDELGRVTDTFGWQNELDQWLNGFVDKEPEVYAAAEQLRAALFNVQSPEEAQAAYYQFFNGLRDGCEESAAKVQTLKEEIAGLEEGIQNPLDVQTDRLYGKESAGGSLNEGSSGASVLQNAQAAVSAYREQLDAAVELQNMLEAIATLENAAADSEEKKAAALALQREGYGYLLENAEAIAAVHEQMLGQEEQQTAAYESQRAALEEQLNLLEAAHESGEVSDGDYDAMSQSLNAALAATREKTLSSAKAMQELGNEAKSTGKDLSGMKKQTEQLGKRLQRTLDTRKDIRNMKALAQQVKRTGGGWDDLSDEVKAFSKSMGVAEGDVDGTIAALDHMEKQTDTSAAGMVGELQGVLGTLETMRAELMSIPPAEMTADASQAMSEIDALIAMINFVLSLAGEAGINMGGSGSKKGGGGGGGGRRSRKEEEEAEAARAAEAAAREAEREREEAYQREIERIEHRRKMGDMTAREEIDALEKVKRDYAKTAEQIMDIDERIFDARQELREKEQDQITTLHDFVLEAIENRYEEQREIEQRRISDSIASWQKWSDDTCAAIRKQIDALDAQEEAEDREATKAEHLHKIASLKDALSFERDSYNQSQLMKQIEEAEKAWADIQKDWAADDQRKSLEDQIKNIEDQAQKEIGSLEKESERVDSVYDDMLKEQSLQAEAQKVLMQSTQEELLGLLASYAPDYEATGRSLGEKIYEGFQSAFGDITRFFDQLDMRFEQMTEKAGQAAFGKTESMKQSGQQEAAVSGPTIHQTVNFNQPVESPAEVARRMQQVSEGLAESL